VDSELCTTAPCLVTRDVTLAPAGGPHSSTTRASRLRGLLPFVAALALPCCMEKDDGSWTAGGKKEFHKHVGPDPRTDLVRPSRGPVRNKPHPRPPVSSGPAAVRWQRGASWRRWDTRCLILFSQCVTVPRRGSLDRRPLTRCGPTSRFASPLGPGRPPGPNRSKNIPRSSTSQPPAHNSTPPPPLPSPLGT
jgi:hypothetical protein